jgi:hypothetical protein
MMYQISIQRVIPKVDGRIIFAIYEDWLKRKSHKEQRGHAQFSVQIAKSPTVLLPRTAFSGC